MENRSHTHCASSASNCTGSRFGYRYEMSKERVDSVSRLDEDEKKWLEVGLEVYKDTLKLLSE
ncbi:MAG: hypothetical protein GX224_07010 [Thermoplasmatales archaeon]|nr:hypothetical protein [Thermoplasmatales archaeon]